jgi:ATP-dependent exoDNAse (exonuclease V) beta subunit
VIDATQRAQALDISQSFIVQAPAGSGKTELLTQRYLKLLAVSDSPESVLAMTFTKKAVSELKIRVIQALKSTSEARPEQPHKQITYDLAVAVLQRSKTLDWRLLETPQRLKISTIDGLANLITSRYPQPKVWVNKQIITQTWQQQNFYLRAAKQTLLSIDEDDFSRCIADVLLYLDNNVNRFYQLITVMLAKRDQWLGQLYVEGVLNVQTLKNSAGNIISQHLAQLLASVEGYFEADFFTALAANTDKSLAEITQLPSVEISDLQAWKNLATLCQTKNGEWRKTLTKTQGFPVEFKAQKNIVLATLAKLTHNIELKTQLAEVHKLPDISFNEAQIQTLADIAQVLKIAVAQLNILFDEQQAADFIQVALDADQALIDEQNSDIALFLDYKIQHLLIDEFQDTSSTQFALIEKLVKNWQQNEPKTLFLVGDPMQSIYLFRQSQVGLFLQVKAFGLANLKPKFLQLSTNFRSVKAVVEANNNFFASIFPQQENAQIGAICYSPSTANIENIDENAGVKFYPFAHQNYEQEARQVLEIVQHNADKEVAILVRNRSHLSHIVGVLKTANIQFEALKTTPLKDELFTKDLISLTRALLNLGDKLAWLALLRAPWCGLLLADILILSAFKNRIMIELLEDKSVLATLTPDGALRAQSLAQNLRAAIEQNARFRFVKRLEFALEQLRPEATLDVKSRMIKTQFLALVNQCETLEQLDIDTLDQQINELYAPSIASRVKLMTIHQAKGLEFDVVIIPGLGRAPRANRSAIIHLQEFAQQSLLVAPIKSYLDENSSDTYQYLQHIEARQGQFESMRLLYVAMTRARQNIHLLATLNKAHKASGNTFLKLLEPLLQHQFEAVNASEKSRDLSVQAPLFERYKTPLMANLKTVDAHEKVNFNQHIETGYKSLLGSFVHQCFELGSFNLSPDALKMRLFERGFSAADNQSAANQIAQLLDKTQQDLNFQWLFKERQSTQVEAEFIHQGKTVVIDRLFIDENILWIVDFKTATPLKNETISQFIIRQKNQHTKQLLFYQEVLTEVYQQPSSCILYCPAVQKIINID